VEILKALGGLVLFGGFIVGATFAFGKLPGILSKKKKKKSCCE
jgi:hypothetical protein